MLCPTTFDICLTRVVSFRFVCLYLISVSTSASSLCFFRLSLSLSPLLPVGRTITPVLLFVLFCGFGPRGGGVQHADVNQAGALFAGLLMVDSPFAKKAHACMEPLTSLFGGMYLGSLGMIVSPVSEGKRKLG